MSAGILDNVYSSRRGRCFHNGQPTTRIQIANVTRYKGRASAKSIARDFPHVVEILVPLGGFGRQLDEIYEFHRQRGIQARTLPGRREGERDIARWAFADKTIADEFAAKFGLLGLQEMLCVWSCMQFGEIALCIDLCASPIWPFAVYRRGLDWGRAVAQPDRAPERVSVRPLPARASEG